MEKVRKIRWTQAEDEILWHFRDRTSVWLKRNGLSQRSVRAINHRREKIGARMDRQKKDGVDLHVILTRPIREKLDKAAAEGESDSLSSIVERALDYYLGDDDG